MPTVWKELQTDQDWDPWVLNQLFSTLAGWQNGEAAAINATTINDPSTVAATWKNGGGGGAGRWIAADSTLIAEAMDDAFTVGKALSGQGADFAGQVNVASLDASGPIHGESLAIDTDAVIDGQVAAAHVEAGTGTFSGLVEAGSVEAGTGTFSGAISAIGATVVGPGGSGNDQALILQHNAGAGQVSWGATDSATPDAILKNDAGDQIGRWTTLGLYLTGTQTAAVGTAGAGDVQCNDLWLVDGANFRRLLASGTAFQVSANANGLAADLTLDAAGLLTLKQLTVTPNGITNTGTFSSTGAFTVTNGGTRIHVTATGVGFNGRPGTAPPDYTISSFGTETRSINMATADLTTVRNVLCTLLNDLSYYVGLLQ